MDQHKSSGAMVTTGIPSIFLIFSVLCLVILSLMSLGTSRTDLRSSQNSLSQTEKYYEACENASHLCAQIEESFEAYTGSAAADECMAYAESILLAHSDISRPGEGAQLYILTVPFTDTLKLNVELLPVMDSSQSRPHLRIQGWYTTQEQNWAPDLHQHLFIPGELQP